MKDPAQNASVMGMLARIVVGNDDAGDIAYELSVFAAAMPGALMNAHTIDVDDHGKVTLEDCDFLADLPLTTDNAPDGAGG